MISQPASGAIVFVQQAALNELSWAEIHLDLLTSAISYGSCVEVDVKQNRGDRHTTLLLKERANWRTKNQRCEIQLHYDKPS
jgi:hypothetical protein